MTWVKPPVSAGFSDEVGLIEDVDNAGLDATIAGAGGENQKAESSRFCWRTQSATSTL